MNTIDLPVAVPAAIPPPTPPPPYSTINWRPVVAAFVTALAGAYGLGAQAASGGDEVALRQQAAIDSIAQAQLVPRVQALEAEVRSIRSEVAEVRAQGQVPRCVAEQQIRERPLDGCAYLLEREAEARP